MENQCSISLHIEYYAGEPLHPEPQYSVINDSTVQVIWEQPFTMEEFSITGYNVTVVDFINQESLLQLSPDTLSFILTHTDSSICTNLTFFIVAVNIIGGSPPGVVNGTSPSCELQVVMQ